MEIKIKSFYKPSVAEIDYGRYRLEILRCVIDDDAVSSYLKNSFVKYVFLKDKLKAFSSDPCVLEIHKFKAKYRGNTYIRIPLMVAQGEDDKYIKGFKQIENADMGDGFMLVSKHDLRDSFKEMKYATKEERIKFGTDLCKRCLEEYNQVLSGNVFRIIITDIVENKIIYDKNNAVPYKDAVNYAKRFILDLKNNGTLEFTENTEM